MRTAAREPQCARLIHRGVTCRNSTTSNLSYTSYLFLVTKITLCRVPGHLFHFYLSCCMSIKLVLDCECNSARCQRGIWSLRDNTTRIQFVVCSKLYIPQHSYILRLNGFESWPGPKVFIIYYQALTPICRWIIILIFNVFSFAVNTNDIRRFWLPVRHRPICKITVSSMILFRAAGREKFGIWRLFLCSQQRYLWGSIPSQHWTLRHIISSSNMLTCRCWCNKPIFNVRFL